MKENYFKPKQITLDLCQCDADMLIYAINNVDWSAYNPDNFGGEGVEAACVYFNDIENQLSDYFNFNEEED